MVKINKMSVSASILKITTSVYHVFKEVGAFEDVVKVKQVSLAYPSVSEGGRGSPLVASLYLTLYKESSLYFKDLFPILPNHLGRGWALRKKQ